MRCRSAAAMPVKPNATPSTTKAVLRRLYAYSRKIFSFYCCFLLFVFILFILLCSKLLIHDAYDEIAMDELFSIERLAELQYNLTAGDLLDTQSPAPVEVWARGPLHGSQAADQLAALLKPSELCELRAICGRCLYHSMQTAVTVQGIPDSQVFVSTGDIDFQWLRDSAVQLAVNLPRMTTHPALRRVIEAAITTPAYYILQDPYANAFYKRWKPTAKLKRWQRLTGKGGWTAERKFELDLGACYIHLLWNYYHTPGLFDPDKLLLEPAVHDAVLLLLKVWQAEQHHEEQSPYRFIELGNAGLGGKVAYTGLIWSGFRPSDDANVFNYNIPGNMYAASALSRLLTLNKRLWKSREVKARASQLNSDVRAGLRTHAVVTAGDGTRVYAYEVDGRGNSLRDFDDPNLPSLLSIPLLGFDDYDVEVYANTRRRILSTANPFFYSGSVLEGLGSPHTPAQYIWPLAHMVRMLTLSSDDVVEQAGLLQALLKMQCGNGLMHESVSVSKPWRCTRPHFEWANALFVATVEQLLGFDCELAAQEEHLRGLVRREGRAAASSRGIWGALWQRLGTGDTWSPLMSERIEATVQHV